MNNPAQTTPFANCAHEALVTLTHLTIPLWKWWAGWWFSRRCSREAERIAFYPSKVRSKSSHGGWWVVPTWG